MILLSFLAGRTHTLHVSPALLRGARLHGACAVRLLAAETETVRGRPHTTESKLKISAANKGRKPWNVGKKHSEETKRKIAERTKAAYLKRQAEKEEAMKRDDPEGYAAMIAEREEAERRSRERKAQREASALKRKKAVRAASP